MGFRNSLKQSISDKIVTIVCYAICLVVFAATLYPFYYILIQSLNNGIDAMRGGVYFFPRSFTLQNFATFLSDSKWINAMVITLLRTLSGVLLNVLFTCMVAYGLSFKELLFRKQYMIVIIVCMYFSGGLIPYYVVLRSLGLLNNFLVYILPSMLNLFFVLISVSFFSEIPKELRESGMVDGASDLRIFGAIILPTSTPLLATMALFIGVNHWNSWLDSAYFVQGNGLRTLGYVMMEVINKSQIKPDSGVTAALASKQTVTTSSVQMAAMVVAVAPIIMVYPFLQKYFVKGMMLGAVKG